MGKVCECVLGVIGVIVVWKSNRPDLIVRPGAGTTLQRLVYNVFLSPGASVSACAVIRPCQKLVFWKCIEINCN